MTSKNRINEFKNTAISNNVFMDNSYFSNCSNNNEHNSDLIKNDGPNSLEERLHQLIVDIKRIHDIILIKTEECDDFCNELKSNLDEFKYLANTSKEIVRKWNSQVNSACTNLSPTQLRIRRSHIVMLSKKLQLILSDFNNESLRYKKKSSSKIQRYLMLSGTTILDHEIDEAIASGKLRHLTERSLLGELHQNIVLRRDGLLNLGQSIKELQEMFVDVMYLVEAQADQVDNIQRNVDDAWENIEEGYQVVGNTKNSTNYFLIFKIGLITLLIVLVILAIINIFSFVKYLPIM